MNHSDSPGSDQVSIINVSTKDSAFMYEHASDTAHQYIDRTTLYHEMFHTGSYNTSFCDVIYTSIERNFMENSADSFAYMMIAKDMLSDGVPQSEVLDYLQLAVDMRHKETYGENSASSDIYTNHSTQLSISAVANLIEQGAIDVQSMTPKDMESTAFQVAMSSYDQFAQKPSQLLTESLVNRAFNQVDLTSDAEDHALVVDTLEYRLKNGQSHLMPAQTRLLTDFYLHQDVLDSFTPE